LTTIQCLCRILDCFFLEGACVLFQIGLALFKIAENEILSSKNELGDGIILIMQNKVMEEPELLFKVPISISFNFY